jgi:putative Holliday junction resolvase
MTRSLGLDIGDKRIGVALSDPGGILATPLTIINRTDDITDIESIAAIVNQNQVGRIIVGLPHSMDGSLGEQAQKVETFFKRLPERIKIPMEFRDERLTTVSARRLMHEVNTKKTRKHRAKDDAVAAALILQGYLDEEH